MTRVAGVDRRRVGVPKRIIVGVVGSSSNSVESRLDAAMLSAGVVVDGGRLNWGASKGVTHTWCHVGTKHRGGSSRGRALRVSVCVSLPLTMMVVPLAVRAHWWVLPWWLRPLSRWSA